MEITSPTQDASVIVFLAFCSAYFAITITALTASLFGWSPPSPFSDFFWFFPAPRPILLAFFLLFAIPFIGMGLGVFWFEPLADILGSTENRTLSLLIYVAVLSAAWLIVFFKTVAMIFETVRDDPGVYIRGVIAIVVILGVYAVTDYFFDIPVIDLIDPSKEAVQ